MRNIVVTIILVLAISNMAAQANTGVQISDIIPEDAAISAADELEKLREILREKPTWCSTWNHHVKIDDPDALRFGIPSEIRMLSPHGDRIETMASMEYFDMIKWTILHGFRIPIFNDKTHVFSLHTVFEYGNWDTKWVGIRDWEEPWVFRLQKQYPMEEHYKIIRFHFPAVGDFFLVTQNDTSRYIAPISKGEAEFLGVDPDIRILTSMRCPPRDNALYYYPVSDSEYPIMNYRDVYPLFRAAFQNYLENQKRPEIWQKRDH
jgi:hypothetical protein